MNTKEKLEKITDLIASKELKFGCEVKRYSKYKALNKTVWKVVEAKSLNDLGIYNQEMGSEHCRFHDKNSYRVLGSPPDLCKVFFWLRNERKIPMFKKFYREEMDEDVSIPEMILIMWDFSKPLLRDQNDDLKNLIYDLLFPEV